jgi:hypothetical protein
MKDLVSEGRKIQDSFGKKSSKKTLKEEQTGVSKDVETLVTKMEKLSRDMKPMEAVIEFAKYLKQKDLEKILNALLDIVKIEERIPFELVSYNQKIVNTLFLIAKEEGKLNNKELAVIQAAMC